VAALVRELATIGDEIVTVCRHEPAGRVVPTRHGDAMLLSDFLLTRILEVAVHGLDVADAVDRPAWLTASAAEHVERLVFGAAGRPGDAFDGDRATVLRKITGRAPLSGAESARLAALGPGRLALG
jgi:hypothetical protein